MPIGKLTALKVKRLTSPGRYGDGGGLWLQVRDADHRSWLFRYTRAGKARQMGLGVLVDVSLADARAAAGECRKQLGNGVDPLAARAAAKEAERAEAPVTTFKAVAEQYLAAHNPSWRNAKHRQQWRSSLERFAYPMFGDRSVASIVTGDVMSIIEPIWQTLPETASRLRGRVEGGAGLRKGARVAKRRESCTVAWPRGQNAAPAEQGKDHPTPPSVALDKDGGVLG